MGSTWLSRINITNVNHVIGLYEYSPVRTAIFRQISVSRNRLLWYMNHFVVHHFFGMPFCGVLPYTYFCIFYECADSTFIPTACQIFQCVPTLEVQMFPTPSLSYLHWLPAEKRGAFPNSSILCSVMRTFAKWDRHPRACPTCVLPIPFHYSNCNYSFPFHTQAFFCFFFTRESLPVCDSVQWPRCELISL